MPQREGEQRIPVVPQALCLQLSVFNFEFEDVDADGRDLYGSPERLLRILEDLDSRLLPRLIRRIEAGACNLPEFARTT